MIEIRPPGDKSISHRALLLSAVATGESSLTGLGDGEDVRSTARLVRALGVDVDIMRGQSGLDAVVRPGDGPRPPSAVLECGNSGTTARLATGMLVGLGFGARLDGDASLRLRPMRRVVYPLQAMGGRIQYLDERNRLPFELRPRATGSLRTLKHRPRVASAQVKSAILLAGVLDRTAVEIQEPSLSRDHTERMLAAMGAPVETATLSTGPFAAFDPEGWDGDLEPLSVRIPGDPSSAAFLAGAALLAGVDLKIVGASGNPTRTGFIAIIESMGARVERQDRGSAAGEPVEDWIVRAPERLQPFEVGGDEIPGVIDELPLLAVLAARASGRSVIRDASELRVKESDRIDRLASNLESIGVLVTEAEDGLTVQGTDATLAGRVDPGGDHRIAMAFGALSAARGVRLEHADPDCAAVSYPRFWEDLKELTR